MKNHSLTAVVSVFHASHEPLRGALLSPHPPRWETPTSLELRGDEGFLSGAMTNLHSRHDNVKSNDQMEIILIAAYLLIAFTVMF